MSIAEYQLEQLCLDWFREGGYEYAYGPEIAHDGEAPERGNQEYQPATETVWSADA